MAEDYYQTLAEEELSEQLSPEAGYYCVDQTGLWVGETARAWGLEGTSVTKEVFMNVLAGRSPDGELQLIQSGENAKHRAAYDLTFNAPKSVSLISALYPELKERVYQAHHEACLEAIRYYEANLVEARRTKDYITERVRTGNLIAAMFLENASRTLDPHVHSHVVVASMTRREDGKFRALSNEEIYNSRVLLGQIYQNSLAKEMTAMNFDVVHKGKGLFEIAEMPAELLESFSQRSEDIDNKLTQLRRLYPTLGEHKLRDLAAKWSRGEKVKLSQEELQSLWEGKFRELGIDKEQLLAQIQTGLHQQELPAVNHAELALKSLVESNSVVKKGEILKLALRMSIGQKTIANVESDLAQAQQDIAVQLAPGLYSTKEMIELEKQLVDTVAAGQGRQQPAQFRLRSLIVPRELELTGDQSRTLLHLVSTTDSTALVEGDAGTGKSTLLKTVVQNFSRAGYDIDALSPSALAAAGLKNKGIMKADTVARYLTKGETGATRRKLLIVDEASLIGSRDLAAIYERVKLGDQVLLIGDSKQYSGLSASAGGLFTKLQELSIKDRLRLKEIVRQQDAAPAVKEAVNLLADKKAREALALLQKHQRIAGIADNQERLQAVVDKFVETSEKQETLVLALSNVEKNALNKMIRERLIEAGRIDAEGITMETTRMKNLHGEEKNFALGYQASDHFYISQPVAGFRRGSQGQILAVDRVNNTIKARMRGFGKRSKTITIDLFSQGQSLSTYEVDRKEFAVGDTVGFLKTDRALGIENGRRGKLIALHKDGTMTVQTDDNRTISFNRSNYAYLDHAFAITNFRAQSADSDAVLFSADTRHGLNYHSVYVAASRAKRSFFIFTNSLSDLFERAEQQEVKQTTLEYTQEPAFSFKVPGTSQDTGHDMGFEHAMQME
jgi:conjugative relaxase-like TrwC/TraI family protein